MGFDFSYLEVSTSIWRKGTYILFNEEERACKNFKTLSNKDDKEYTYNWNVQDYLSCKNPQCPTW